MWIQETLVDWLEPFTKKYYIWFLFKFDSNYKAIQVWINNIFDSHDEDFKNLLISFITKESPKEIVDLVTKITQGDLYENINDIKEQAFNHPFLWDIIYNYFTSNNECKIIINDVFINLKSFRETFDKQISLYLQWKEINEKLLKKQKENAIKFLLLGAKKFEKFYLNQVTLLQKDLIPRLLFDTPLPITQIEIDDLNKKTFKLKIEVDNWANDEYYKNLANLFDIIFDEIIWLIKL